MVGFPSIHFGGRWWEIQPTPSGISIHWMDFHLVVGIPSILDRFPTTWMEIQPIGLVGPDVAVLHWYSSNWNAPPAGKVLCVVCSSKWGLERSRHVIGGTQQPGQSPKLNPNLGLTTSFHFALLNVYFYWKSSTTSFCSSHPDPLLWKGKMRRGRTTSKIIARRHHHNSIQVMISLTSTTNPELTHLSMMCVTKKSAWSTSLTCAKSDAGDILWNVIANIQFI